MSTIKCTYDEFKAMARDFFLALPTASLESVDNGMKCLGIAYLGIEFGDNPLDRINQEVGAPTLLRLATKKAIEREVEIEHEAHAIASRPRPPRDRL